MPPSLGLMLNHQPECVSLGPGVGRTPGFKLTPEAAGRALCLMAWPAAVFASAKSHLKSLVEQKGALSTLKRCTGASHNACAHCLRLPRACQGPQPSAPTVLPSLRTFALFVAGIGAVSSLELAARALPVCDC